MPQPILRLFCRPTALFFWLTLTPVVVLYSQTRPLVRTEWAGTRLVVLALRGPVERQPLYTQSEIEGLAERLRSAVAAELENHRRLGIPSRPPVRLALAAEDVGDGSLRLRITALDPALGWEADLLPPGDPDAALRAMGQQLATDLLRLHRGEPPVHARPR
jgi:hypothetical protein